eukprot:1193987-Rhodomonas_salina.4
MTVRPDADASRRHRKELTSKTSRLSLRGVTATTASPTSDSISDLSGCKRHHSGTLQRFGPIPLMARGSPKRDMTEQPAACVNSRKSGFMPMSTGSLHWRTYQTQQIYTYAHLLRPRRRGVGARFDTELKLIIIISDHHDVREIGSDFIMKPTPGDEGNVDYDIQTRSLATWTSESVTVQQAWQAGVWRPGPGSGGDDAVSRSD